MIMVKIKLITKDREEEIDIEESTTLRGLFVGKYLDSNPKDFSISVNGKDYFPPNTIIKDKDIVSFLPLKD